MRLSRVAAVAVGTLLLLAATACSSSSRGEVAGDRSPSSATTVVPPNDDDADSTTGSEAPAAGFSSTDCADVFAAYTALYAEVGGFGSGADPGQLSDFEQKTTDLEGKVPDAVRDDFRTVAAAYQQYAEAVKGLDFSNLLDSNTQSQLEQADAALNDPAVKAAQGRIDDYFTHTCGS